MPITEPFEKYVAKYEKWFTRYCFAYESEIQAINFLMPEHATGVEIGVGTGRFASALGIDIGIEPSRAMSKIAQKRGINIIGGVAEALPIKSSQFDFALMVTTICFLDNIEDSFIEAYRVIKSDGFIIIGFVDRDSRLGNDYQKYKTNNVFYKLATFYSVEEVVLLLEKAGFNNFSFAQTIFEDLDDMRGFDPIEEGYGRGSFIVIRGTKPG